MSRAIDCLVVPATCGVSKTRSLARSGLSARQWLGCEDVEGRPGEPPGRQGCGRRLLVDDAASAGADEEGTVRQQRQATPVEQAACLRSESNDIDENVGARQEPVELPVGCAVLIRGVAPAPRPVGDRATERGEPGGQRLPDRPEAHQPDPAPGDLRGSAPEDLVLDGPASGAHLVLRPGQPAGKAEHRTQDPLGHGHGVEARHVGQRDARGGQRVEIVGLDADAGLLHERQVGRGPERFGIQTNAVRRPVAQDQVGVGKRREHVLARPGGGQDHVDGQSRQQARHLFPGEWRQGDEPPRRVGHAREYGSRDVANRRV